MKKPVFKQISSKSNSRRKKEIKIESIKGEILKFVVE